MTDVRQFGVLGNGLQDDYAAMQDALYNARELYIPQGTYPISQTLLVPSNTTITADPGAKIVMRSTVRRHQDEFLLSNADPVNGNCNITLIGGIWDGANRDPENQKPDIFEENGYSGALLNFVNVNNLTLRQLVLANSVTYYVRMGSVHHFTIEDISFVSDRFGVNQDGLHFGGDVRHGTVRNIRALSYGQTNDDMIAFNADDSMVRVENRGLSRADIEDITVDGVYAECCYTIFRMLSVDAAIRNIRIKNVHAGYRCYAINADAARYCRTPLFTDAERPQGVGCIEDISIENMVCTYIHGVPFGTGDEPWNMTEALVFESHTDRLKIDGFRLQHRGDHIPKAFRMTHVSDQTVIADGKPHAITTPDELLQIDDLQTLEIRRGK